MIRLLLAALEWVCAAGMAASLVAAATAIDPGPLPVALAFAIAGFSTRALALQLHASRRLAHLERAFLGQPIRREGLDDR